MRYPHAGLAARLPIRKPLSIRPPKCLPPFDGQPVAKSDAQLPDTLDAPYSRSQVGALETAIGRLESRAENVRKR